jgi:hypothetical protein
VIELVDRLETENERWISVLFEHDGREEHRLQAVRASVTDYAPKTPQRRATVRLGVVGEIVQVVLDRKWRAKARHETALLRRESPVSRHSRRA